MTKILIIGILITFYKEDAELFRSYVGLKNGVLAGLTLNRTDTKMGSFRYTKSIAPGGYEGRVWKFFNFTHYLYAGFEVDFGERSFHISGLYPDTSIPGFTLYNLIEHLQTDEEVILKTPIYLKAFKNFNINSSLEFSWTRTLLHHGEAHSDYSFEVLKFNRSELNLIGRIGGDFRTDFLTLSLSFGIPVFLKGEAELGRYSVTDRGATVIIEPFGKWIYDPKPPPLIKILSRFRFRNFGFHLTYSLFMGWGGKFKGIDAIEYKIDGVPSYELGGIASYNLIQNEFFLGFTYAKRDYETANIPLFNGDKFCLLLGYKRGNQIGYGLFLKTTFSKMDYKSQRDINLFRTSITTDFLINF